MACRRAADSVLSRPMLTALLVVLLIIGTDGVLPAARPGSGPDRGVGVDVNPRAALAGVVHSEVIGYSVQHRPIVAYELGDPHASYTALVLGSSHGYFERAGETVTRLLRTLKLPVGLHLWVIDTINPDGDALHQRGNAHGVDLNRNWPYLWIPISRTGCTAFSCHYSGPRALSEPESAAMTRFLKKVKPNRVVSLHQPLVGVDTTNGGARDPAFRDALARNLGLPLKAFTCFGGCHGTMTGWLTHATSTTAIVVEFGQTVSGTALAKAATGIVSALMTGVKVPGQPVVWSVTGTAGPYGPAAGGNVVTITGAALSTTWRVTFNGVAGTRLTVLSPHRITVVAPRHPPGRNNVRVTTVGGTTPMTVHSRYTYLAVPTVGSVTGTDGGAGPTSGGNAVSITGTALSTASRVTFGGVPGTQVKALSANRITVVAPRHAAGPVTVRVTTAGGVSAATTASYYTYRAP